MALRRGGCRAFSPLRWAVDLGYLLFEAAPEQPVRLLEETRT